jgi:hypothetical protein
MQYVIKYYDKTGLHLTNNVNNITEETFNYGIVEVEDERQTHVVNDMSEFEELCDVLARSIWRPNYEEIKMADPVNPEHYKKYIDEMEWLEAMMKLPSMRDPKVFTGALELQVRKYLDRNGRKDETHQEVKKALFYLKFWSLYLEKGQDTRVADVFQTSGV